MCVLVIRIWDRISIHRYTIYIHGLIHIHILNYIHMTILCYAYYSHDRNRVVDIFYFIPTDLIIGYDTDSSALLIWSSFPWVIVDPVVFELSAPCTS